MGRERRRAERYISNLFVQLENPFSNKRLGRGVVIDVSQTGFGMDTEADLSLEEEYFCHIEIPFALRAKVVRRVSEGQLKRYGLKIVGQGILDKLMLRKILKGLRETKKV